MVFVPLQAGVIDPGDLGVLLHEFRHRQSVGTVLGHPQVQGLQTHVEQVGVHGRGGGAEVPHELDRGLGDVGPAQTKPFCISHTVVALIRGAQAGVAVRVSGPVKAPAVHNGAPHAVGVPVHVFGGGVGDNVRPPLEGPAAHRGGKGIVHDERHPMGVGGAGKLLNVQNNEGGVGDGLPKHRLGVGLESGVQLLFRAIGVHESEVNAHPLHGNGKEVEGPPVDGRGGHHVIPGGTDVEHGKEVGRLAGGGQHRRRAPLQGTDLRGHPV